LSFLFLLPHTCLFLYFIFVFTLLKYCYYFAKKEKKIHTYQTTLLRILSINFILGILFIEENILVKLKGKKFVHIRAFLFKKNDKEESQKKKKKEKESRSAY
jgi:hypothetical protein